MTNSHKIEAEKRELNILIGKGITFDIERRIFRRKKGLLGLIQKRTQTKEILKFSIEEPTLSTLDRLSSLQIELKIDESVMSSDTGLNEAKKLSNQYSRTLAKIIAVAVLGQDYTKMIQEGPRIRYVNDDYKLQELTDLFFHCIRPSKLLELVLIITSISNLGDFCNSIRFMSAERTTMPLRVEENKEA